MTYPATASLSDTAFEAACIASAEAARTRLNRLFGPSTVQGLTSVSYRPGALEVGADAEGEALYACAQVTKARLARLFSTVH